MQTRSNKKHLSVDQVKEILNRPETKKNLQQTIANMKASGEKKKVLSVEEFRQLIEKPEVKQGIKKVADSVKSKLKETYEKQLKLEKEEKKKFENTAIFARRDAIKDVPKWQEQKDIFLKNLHKTVNDNELIAIIQNELKTLSGMFNKSPSLEEAMFKNLDPLLVYINPKMLSSYLKIADVFRQVIPPIKVSETTEMAKDLKKLVEINTAVAPKTLEGIYTAFRNPFKNTFGSSSKYWKSDHYAAFYPFEDRKLVEQNKKKTEEKMLARKPIKILYSQILKAIKELSENNSDIKADAQLAAVALATGMREAEIVDDDIVVSTVKGEPHKLYTKGVKKQRNLEASQKEAIRPIILLTGKQVVEMIDYIRSFDPKDLKYKVSFIEDYFPEAFKFKYDEESGEKKKSKHERITSVLRAIYAAAVHDLKEYNPDQYPLHALLEKYFNHKVDKGTSAWYHQFKVRDDTNKNNNHDDENQEEEISDKKTKEKTKKLSNAADCDEVRRLKDEIFALKQFIMKKDEARAKRYESKIRNIRTEEELIKQGKEFLKKNPRPTTRQFRQGLSIGNDKVKWLMEKLGARRSQKEWNQDQKAKREARKKAREQQENEEEENEE